MPITYNHATEPIIAEIRDYVGDTIDEVGPRWVANANQLDQSNFSDEVINFYYQKEGENVGRTVARLFEILHGDWLKASDSVTDGQEKEDLKEKANRYAKAAERWRKRYGYVDDDAASEDDTLFEVFTVW